MGMHYSFFVTHAVRLHKSKVPSEYIQELTGIQDGMRSLGISVSVDDLIGWNAYMEMTGYWWPTVASKYGSAKQPSGHYAKAHCSAFVATGSATQDGFPVIAHQTFTEFWNGQYFNVAFDITPSAGNRLIFQGCPGYISSMTDFWLNSAGLAVVETTFVGFNGYSESGDPEWTRVRQATQYANNIDQWAAIMLKGNNGGYANGWLLADMNANEIGQYELGLRYQNLTKKTDGWFFGDNAPWDPRIRHLECTDVGYNDIRQQTGARRTRWPTLLNEWYGRINQTVAQTIMGDTYDVYLNKVNPSSRTICSHYDEDPQYYVSDPNAVWNEPFVPAGSVDGKVTTKKMAQNMGVSFIFGRADGAEFNAPKFLKAHPQWAWQTNYLQSRPSQPWTLFPPSHEN